jgi:hypothetical protein
MRRVLGLLLLGGVLAVVVAGCGGGGGSKPLDKADYEKQMQTIGGSLTASLNELSSSTSSAAKAATALTKVQTDLRKAADELDAMTPPTAVKTQHEQLTKAVREFADELDPLIKDLKAGKLTALSTLPSLKGLSDIQTASTAITNKGYKIGG